MAARLGGPPDLAAQVWTITGTAERNGRERLHYLADYLDACAAAGGKPPEGPALERFFVWLDHPRGEDTAGYHDGAARPEPDTSALP